VGLELDTTTVLLVTFAGAVALAGFLVALLKRERAVWILGGMLFTSCLGFGIEANGRVVAGVFYPLQARRSQLFLMCGVLLSLHLLLHFRAMRGRRLSVQAVILMVMGFYAALLRFVHEGGAAGLESVVYAVVTLIPLLLVAPIVIAEFRDPIRFLRMTAIVNAMWVGGTLIQIAINPSMVMLGKQQRFIGLLGNPQHAASLVAVLLAVSIYLFMNDPQRRFRLLALGLLGINVILLGWTGSRTGLGMAVLAVSGVLYARFGKAILWLPAVAILAALAYELLKMAGLTIGFERLASTENTRADSWSNLLHNGLSSPLIGMGVEGAGDSENGYLYGFAAYGIGMVLLTMALIGATAVTSLKLWKRRQYLPLQYRTLSDFLIGYNALYFGGSFFEGYMMARVASNLVFFMLFAGIASQLIRLTDEAIQAGELEDEETQAHDWYADEIDPAPA
jgi:hypothetical protein